MRRHARVPNGKKSCKYNVTSARLSPASKGHLICGAFYACFVRVHRRRRWRPREPFKSTPKFAFDDATVVIISSYYRRRDGPMDSRRDEARRIVFRNRREYLLSVA